MSQLKLVDLVIEVLDARLPESSRHPQSQTLFGNKPRLVVLAKEDLADPEKAKQWLKLLTDSDSSQSAISLDLKRVSGKGNVISQALRLTESKRNSLAKKGLLPRPMRACVVGMPNVGKSSLINWLVGRRKARVGNKPGITVGAQWIRLHPALELLDTPGILPPVEFAPETALKLALCNLLTERTYDQKQTAEDGLELINSKYSQYISGYAVDSPGQPPSLETVAAKKNCLGPGGQYDILRAAGIFLTDLRSGRLGRITLD